jgi:pimeloyl-ACP methyl ester carboxylesterase
MGPSLEQWRESGHFVAFGLHRVFCVDSAPGDRARPTLVLIHGFPTASWDFAKLWPTLTAEFRVLAADMLGFGFSSKPHHHAYSIDEQADLFECIVAATCVDRYHILAHDYGDTVAQELLARDNTRPTRTIETACFLNGGLFPETHRPRLVQKLLRSPLGPLVSRLVNRRGFARSMTALFGPGHPPTESELGAFWILLTAERGHRLAHELIHYIAERIRNRQRWLDALCDARCPLGLINGSADPVSGAHMVARYRELVGTGYIAELPGIGHYPQVEAPALVLEHYHRFRRQAADAGHLA